MKDERKTRGWSQADLAEKMASAGLKAHATTVAKIEGLDRAVRLDEAAIIAGLFELSLDEMLALKRYDQQSILDVFLATAGTSANEINSIAERVNDAFVRLQVEPGDLVRRSHESVDADLVPAIFRSYMAGLPAQEAVSRLIDARELLRYAVQQASVSDDALAESHGGTDAAAVRRFLESFLPPDEFKNPAEGGE
ncbi:helix-turn-helix transcriptional regulator [Gordonia sp. CPCC 205515]|uniref:helix-turn-helix domain-containing protein n=1 Tax=Gordonia sp. CPCC 205515 TaxID=3140791 RepID=UPI003AF3D502